MWTTWFLFLLIWAGYVWTLSLPSLFSETPSPKNIAVREPVFKRNCNANKVPCVDDCSFLCVEENAQCVGGVCRSSVSSTTAVPCNEKKGGMIMYVRDPTPHWSCVCTNPSFFRGDDCGTKSLDVCEHGVFIYTSRDHFQCFCMDPYKKIEMNGKPYCVEKQVARVVDNNDFLRQPVTYEFNSNLWKRR